MTYMSQILSSSSLSSSSFVARFPLSEQILTLKTSCKLIPKQIASLIHPPLWRQFLVNLKSRGIVSCYGKVKYGTHTSLRSSNGGVMVVSLSEDGWVSDAVWVGYSKLIVEGVL